MNGRVPERDQQNIECDILLGGKREEESPPNLNDPLYPEAHTPHQNTRNLNSCSQIVFWKCKLWMVIISAFVVMILVIILSLVLYSEVYIDEDEYLDAELIASGIHHNFSGILNIRCANNSDPPLSASAYTLLSENLSKRLTDVYSDSPALGRYFISAEVSFSDENNTASYHLCFSVPAETEAFMKYRMSEEFLMNILRQNIYDQEEIHGQVIPECTNMTLDPTSISLTIMQAIDTER
ncbi:TPA-induced transmembrane protein [Elgaria multicarinata webbii]|uniref:TPA-induced transmembrane protein n=1 Tax=Elgaria multicarinata webbii TaxID=159646 RepID=UPI002FCD1B47